MNQKSSQDARVALARHLRQESDRAGRNGNALALIHIEIDGAAQAEQAHGEGYGNAVLSAVRGRLGQRLRSYDLVAPAGPTALAVVLSDVKGGAPAVAGLVERLHDLINEPVSLGLASVRPGCRTGVAIVLDRTPGPEVIRRAGVAVARAADAGRPCYHDPAIDAEMLLRRTLNEDLRAAIAGGLVDVAYQPVYEAGGDLPVSVEALARWERNGQAVPPQTFVAHAEENGLIGALGEAILRKACAQAAAWDTLVLSVNVSPIQLRDPRFPALVEEILADTGLDPAMLEIEVTESVFAAEAQTVAERLRTLRTLGVRVALDDFGTGFSSLGYLRSLPIDRIKIDRSFVNDTGRESRAIIEAVIGLAAAIDIDVTAEGVETEAERDYLVSRGCTRMQGYLYGRPMTASAIGELLEDHPAPAP